MSPEVYLQLATAFLSYFLKTAVAWLACWLLARMITTPRQKFALWLAFVTGSLSYWVYTTAGFVANHSVPSAGTEHASSLPWINHEFFVPAQFQHRAAVLGRFVVYAYIAGVLLLLLAAAWKRSRLHMLLKQGSAPSADLANLFREMRPQFGVRRCELLVLSGISSPATVGWWRPRILLPQGCEGLGDSAAMADILHHELAHVARRDYFWSSLSDTVCQILFFHPAVWLARKQMRLQREMACDWAVVGACPEHRADYATTLTRIARLSLERSRPRLRTTIGIDFAASPSLLARRVHAILSDPQQCSWGQKLLRFATGGTLVAGYGFFCAALVIVIAFAPLSRIATAEMQPSGTLHESHSRQRVVSSRIVHPEQSLITESPAYRLQVSSPADPYRSGERVSIAGDSETGVASCEIPSWGQPGRRTRWWAEYCRGRERLPKRRFRPRIDARSAN
jgi:beta-lactamase regulating signal transducer with metallopeptidase domain